MLSVDDSGVTLRKRGTYAAYGPDSVSLQFGDFFCQLRRTLFSVRLGIASEALGRCWLVARVGPFINRRAVSVARLVIDRSDEGPQSPPRATE